MSFVVVRAERQAGRHDVNAPSILLIALDRLLLGRGASATVNGVSDGLLSGDEIRVLERLDDWRAMYDAIEARFRTRDFATGLEFVNRIGAAAEAADHHPDITCRTPMCTSS